jgi:hypothetical protein
MSGLSIALLQSGMRSCNHLPSQNLPAARSFPSRTISDISNDKVPNSDTKRDANTTEMHTYNAIDSLPPERRYQCPQSLSLSPDGRPKLDMLYNLVSITPLQQPMHGLFPLYQQSLSYLIRRQISIEHKFRKRGIELLLSQASVKLPICLRRPIPERGLSQD